MIQFNKGLFYNIPNTYHSILFEFLGLVKIWLQYLNFYLKAVRSKSVIMHIEPGSCIFHHGVTILGARVNITNSFRGAMACAYMPDGADINGIQLILSDEQVDSRNKKIR